MRGPRPESGTGSSLRERAPPPQSEGTKKPWSSHSTPDRDFLLTFERVLFAESGGVSTTESSRPRATLPLSRGVGDAFASRK